MTNADTIQKECRLRITSHEDEICKKGLHPEVLLASMEDCFEALENYIELDESAVDHLVQQITEALPDHTAFLVNFRKCIYYLNGRNITHNSMIMNK